MRCSKEQSAALALFFLALPVIGVPLPIPEDEDSDSILVRRPRSKASVIESQLIEQRSPIITSNPFPQGLQLAKDKIPVPVPVPMIQSEQGPPVRYNQFNNAPASTFPKFQSKVPLPGKGGNAEPSNGNPSNGDDQSPPDSSPTADHQHQKDAAVKRSATLIGRTETLFENREVKARSFIGKRNTAEEKNSDQDEESNNGKHHQNHLITKIKDTVKGAFSHHDSSHNTEVDKNSEKSETSSPHSHSQSFGGPDGKPGMDYSSPSSDTSAGNGNEEEDE